MQWCASFNFESDRLLDLEFEVDVRSDLSVAYGKILQQLDEQPEVPDVPLRRINDRPLNDLVVNLDEVTRCLEGTEFEWMPKD